MTKEEALNKIEELKKFVADVDSKKEEKITGIAIMSRLGGIKFQSTKTVFKEAVIEGKADLCGANLRDANLRDANLCGANLRGADLCGADLCGANLRDANLRDANLCGADLCGANLRDANLRDANLCGANLRDANLCGAELASAKFYGRGGIKVIKKANLEGFLGALGFVLED